VLKQAGVACHQCRRSETKDLPEREVPGHYREHWPERLVTDEGSGGFSRDTLIRERFGAALSIVRARECALFRLRLGGGNGLPHLRGHQRAELTSFAFQNLRRLEQLRGSFGKGSFSMGFECIPCKLDASVQLSAGEGFECFQSCTRIRID
jgi:hypothetical protein